MIIIPLFLAVNFHNTLCRVAKSNITHNFKPYRISEYQEYWEMFVVAFLSRSKKLIANN